MCPRVPVGTAYAWGMVNAAYAPEEKPLAALVMAELKP
jgi:hypothetical protein